MFYLPQKLIDNNIFELKKNGIDVLLLTVPMAINGRIKNTNPNILAKAISWSYNHIQNGLKYAAGTGLIRWDIDDIVFDWSKKIFGRGNGGYFAVHDVFSSEEFIKNVNEVPKRFAIKVLCRGIGSRSHPLAYCGIKLKKINFMKWAGIERPHKIKEILKSLEPYFIITYNDQSDVYTVKIRPCYLADPNEKKFNFSLGALFQLFKNFGYYITKELVLNDILWLAWKYGPNLVEFALSEARYSWNKVKNLPGYLHTIIMEATKNEKFSAVRMYN